jgi:hypothetical protein
MEDRLVTSIGTQGLLKVNELQGRTTDNNGRHYDFIKNRIPSVIQAASLQRIQALGAAKKGPSRWVTTASNYNHNRLKNANLELWATHNKVDKALDKLQNIYEFAEPLLSAALKKQYGVDDDVRTTYLHLYLPKERPWYALNISSGVTTRTVSLLDAALHNFALSETCEADSDFISQPDERGLFDIKPIKRKMSIAQFQTLCRELDIGAQYTEHLESFLLPGDPVAETYLKRSVVKSQKAAFTAAAQLAVMTGDIQRDTLQLVLAMLDGQRNLTFKGKIVQFGELSIMGTALTGIVLISPDLERTREVAPIIAYLPHDPEHPLKEYPSVTDFLNELTRQLRDNNFIPSSGMTYRQYFSQFVDQPERGAFFAGLQQRLFTIEWHQKEPLDQRPTWREEPVPTPHLQFAVTPVSGDLWEHLFQKKLNKILNDAKHIAVSTADTDSNARWAWWDNFKKIVSDIFNVALMVLTPFVPGLGELMMAYTAYQITSDVIESLVDLAEGLWIEAAEHIVSVVTNVVELAIFAAGAELGKIPRLRLSAFIESLKPVVLPEGQTRLWNPDLTPYALPDFKLPADSQPNALGLHTHEGKHILALDNQHYEVQRQDPITQRYRIKHPQRPNAYSPELEHNGLGAWTHEAENPRTWDSPTLMRRLGHGVDGFSDAELEQTRIISGTEDGELRRMYVDNTPPPPLLADSLERLQLQKQTRQAIENIRTGDALEPTAYWFEPLATYLDGWPTEKALKVYENADLTGHSRHYGNAEATPAQTLSVSLSHITSGELPQSLVDFLSNEELRDLIGSHPAKQEQIKALRNRLADQANSLEPDIFNQLYRAAQSSDTSSVQLLCTTFPDLPANVAQTLLTRASATEFERMTDHQQIPLRLKSLAREAAFEARTNHAYEGFQDDVQMVADTERLVLNTLRIFTDSFGDLRIEVHDGTYDGDLRCSVGPEDASTLRKLIREQPGKYAVYDASNTPLHAADDFYQAVLNALPADQRARLGYRPGQGAQFKQWVMVKTEAPAERRTVLAEPPIRATQDLQTERLLRGPSLSTIAETPEERVREIYPHFNEREVAVFVDSLGEPDEALETLKRLEREQYELGEILDKWRNQQPEHWGPDRNGFLNGGGQHIADRLMQCFERKSTVFGERSTRLEDGYVLDLSVELSRYDLELWWKKLPDIQRYLDQIETLNLDRTTFSANAGGLLKNFSKLRQLSARGCQLTQLPEGIGAMHYLRTLRLMSNRIRLTPRAVEHLKHLTRMETIRLDDNPQLGLMPNVERMPKLKILSLSNTGATTWPEGLLNKRRPRGFLLDLMQNPLTEIPSVVPGSDDARLVARARLYVKDLSDANRIAYQDYRRSVGLNAEQVYSAMADRAIDQWPMSDDSQWWSDQATGLGTFRVEAWHDLMNEPGAEDFFALIQKQTRSADYLAGGDLRQQLSDRVWRMIEAMDLDSDLRTELFEMATSPTTCADAGAQVFNHMGIKVLAAEAYALSTSATVLESQLVTLAKGAARLMRVDDIARADFGSRTGTPDEVEVYLAYETGLAERLGLPWQSQAMLYREVAGVSAETLDIAFDTVISMGEGDGLINDMLTQTFWETYLRNTYPREFQRNARNFELKNDLLEELRDAQRAWSESPGSSIEQRQKSKQRLLDLATQLNVAPTTVLTAERMSDAVYEGLQNDIGYEEQQLSRRLTREALQRAGQ